MIAASRQTCAFAPRVLNRIVFFVQSLRDVSVRVPAEDVYPAVDLAHCHFTARVDHTCFGNPGSHARASGIGIGRGEVATPSRTGDPGRGLLSDVIDWAPACVATSAANAAAARNWETCLVMRLTPLLTECQAHVLLDLSCFADFVYRCFTCRRLSGCLHSQHYAPAHSLVQRNIRI